MKDFFDLLKLSQMFEFDGALLSRAMRATFERRGTPLPAEVPAGLTPTFAGDAAKQKQWTAFVRKAAVADVGDLVAVSDAVSRFVWPPLEAAGAQMTFGGSWRPERASWSSDVLL